MHLQYRELKNRKCSLQSLYYVKSKKLITMENTFIIMYSDFSEFSLVSSILVYFFWKVLRFFLRDDNPYLGNYGKSFPKLSNQN